MSWVGTAIPGYSFFRQDRTRRKGGGVGIYSSSSLFSEVVETPYHAAGLQSNDFLVHATLQPCELSGIANILYSVA